MAPDHKLSNELRIAVRKIIKVSPALAEHFKVNRAMITCLINDVEYTPLAYSNDRMDGKLANIFLADEAGARWTVTRWRPCARRRSPSATSWNHHFHPHQNDNNAS